MRKISRTFASIRAKSLLWLSNQPRVESGRPGRIRFTAPPCPVIFSSADLLNWWASTESFLVRLPLPRILTSSKTPLARPLSKRSARVDGGAAVERLVELADVDDGHFQGKLAVVEAALGDSPRQGRLAARVAERDRSIPSGCKSPCGRGSRSCRVRSRDRGRCACGFCACECLDGRR